MNQKPYQNKKLVLVSRRTAPIEIVVTDGGDFGFTICGKCGTTLEESAQNCPHCGIKLEGVRISPPTGGSDF